MTKDTMTPRERWLAAVSLQPVDRLPFWPKIFESYPRAQEAPFFDMPIPAIHQWIGSDQHISLMPCYREVRTHTVVETVTQGYMRKTTYRTPHACLEGIDHFDVDSQSWHPVSFPVQKAEDIGVLTEIYADCRVEPDPEKLAEATAWVQQIGDGASTWSVIGESPMMNWVEYEAGVKNAHFFLADYRQDVEALFAAHHRVLLRRAEIMADKAPTDFLYMIENTSTTLISPQQFRTYCQRHLTDYGRVVQAAGRQLIFHMCGHLKALLPDLASLPGSAFEAFTSPTLGNTTLLDGRTAMPDKCLIGGTNAVLWTRPTEEIIATLEQDLGALPHHRGIVVTSAGVMPPLAKPEVIKAVADWVRAYPAHM